MAQRLVSLGTKVVTSSTRLAFKSVELGQGTCFIHQLCRIKYIFFIEYGIC